MKNKNEQPLELHTACDRVEEAAEARDKALDDLVVDHLVWRRAMSEEGPDARMTGVYDQSRNGALENFLDAQMHHDNAVEAWAGIANRVAA
jgi:hypothetical protein